MPPKILINEQDIYEYMLEIRNTDTSEIVVKFSHTQIDSYCKLYTTHPNLACTATYGKNI